MKDDKLNALKAKLRALLAKTIKAGCSEHEAAAAAVKAREIMREHGLDEADLVFDTDEAPRRTRRSTIRDNLWSMVARCTNTVAVADIERGVVRYYGRSPAPQIAVYLHVVLDRAVDREIAGFKATTTYRRRRSFKTKRIAVADFTGGLVDRLRCRLADIFGDDASEEVRAKARDWARKQAPHTRSMSVPQAPGRYSEAHTAGWRAGEKVGLHRGVGEAEAQAGLTAPTGLLGGPVR